MLMSGSVARVYSRWIILAAGLWLTTCGDEKGPECEKPGDCVGRPAGNYCKVIASKARCVTDCQTTADGKDNCPTLYKCTGKADDGSLFCQ
jgi:hypothetical protein